MKQLFIALLVTVSLSAAAQQAKDTTKPKTLVLTGTDQGFTYLLNVLAQSKLQIGGEQLSYAQVAKLIDWIQSVKEIPNAEQPKKK